MKKNKKINFGCRKSRTGLLPKCVVTHSLCCDLGAGRWGGRRWGAGALGAGRTGTRRWADWAQARGACAAGAGSVPGIGRQGARLVHWLGQFGAHAASLGFDVGF